MEPPSMDLYALVITSLVGLLMLGWLIAFALDPEAFQRGAKR